MSTVLRTLSCSVSARDDFSDSGDQDFLGDSGSCDIPFRRVIRKSKSEPVITIGSSQENVSALSDPIQKMTFNNKFEESHKSCSDVLTQNCVETESEVSIFHMRKSEEPQSHRDPVIVFWERSDRREIVESDIIVKFVLPGGEVFTYSFSKMSKVEEIKQILSEMFKVPVSILLLEHNSSWLPDCLCVSDIAIERFGSVTFQLSSQDPARYPLIFNNVYPDIPTNDVLTVIVHKGQQVKQVIVEIENRAIYKPFLGGYRHRITKVEYHHAFTQTTPKPLKNNVISRDTQTLGQCKVVETSKEKFTQTTHTLIELESNKIIIGEPYRRSHTLDLDSKDFQEKVLLIQRNLRSWLVRKMMLKMKDEYRRCIHWEKQQKLKIEAGKEALRLGKEKAQTKPESKGDFELLYHNVEEWRKVETSRINTLGSIALRKSESYSMLEMEIQYINAIERQRIKFKTEQQRRAQERILEKTASPMQWRGSNGQALYLDSLETQRARKFRNLYQNLQDINFSKEKRIDVLEEVKRTLLQYPNPLVSELVLLLDREKQILMHNLKQTNIGTLRARINFMFLEYIKDPAVNPESRKYLPENICRKVEMYKCQSCQNIVPYFKFSLHSKANGFQKCHKCCWVREIGGPRIDVNPIRHILNAVRREELKQSFYTSVALIMQEQDFYHLIINVWLGHSAIGGSGNLEELRLGRWDYSQCWSPWNCILLTAEELKAHLRFPNPEQIYSVSFAKKIKQRHQMGRIYFSELAAYAVRNTNENVKVSKMIKNFNAYRVHIDKQTSSIENHD